MTDIEQKALALLNEVAKEMGLVQLRILDTDLPGERALCRAIEQHEAFRQEVSDAVEWYFDADIQKMAWFQDRFARFIIAKPDPLIEVLDSITQWSVSDQSKNAETIRAAMKARGYEFRKIEGEGL